MNSRFARLLDGAADTLLVLCIEHPQASNLELSAGNV